MDDIRCIAVTMHACKLKDAHLMLCSALKTYHLPTYQIQNIPERMHTILPHALPHAQNIHAFVDLII